MSKYIEDIQGKIVSNPINETNTKYPYIELEDGTRHADTYPIDSQYMYNHNEPVSDIDTAYYADYRNKTEELRKRTESTYEALESCLVPAEIPGMSFQPYEFINSESPDGEITEEKVKSFTYFFQDHLSPIGFDSKEFVFRTNKVKFIDDRHRRLIYDRTIHIMGLKEDEDNKVPFKDVIYRTFFEYYNGKYFSLVRTTNAALLTHDGILRNILDSIKKSKEYYIVIDEDGNEKKVESISDFDYVLQCGQDVNTLIPSTLYNLYNIGWTNAAMVFLNGLAIDWTKIIISVDNIDTFIIVSNLYDSASELIDDDKEIFLDYVHIPFKVAYIVGSITNTSLEYKYVKNNRIDHDVIFVIDKDSASIRFTNFSSPADYFKLMSTSGIFDRVICLDDNIKFAEFVIEAGDDENIKDAGINYTKSFKQFCGNDYRCKLKQFNFLGFELNRYFDYPDSQNRGTFKNDDFTITWHPFNIMDIRFKRLYNRRRIFKVFYNTKVLYDQDNILRIKNHDMLSDEYEKYRQDVTANIETYMNEIYILAKKDIGTYIATNGGMYGYKYHYVTPYECFLLYNAINVTLGQDTVTFDEFRNINVADIKLDSSKFKTQINHKLIANSEGKCTWVIPTNNTQCPAVKIVEIATGQIVLADVKFNDKTNEVILTMNKDGNNIAENTYLVTLYYANYVIGNNQLTQVGNKCEWIISNIKSDSSVTAVYETETNQVVLTDIDIIDNDSVKITFMNTGDIPADKYKAVININETDKHSFLNYMNGGFIAVPVNEDSMFAEKIKDEDIFTNGILNDNIREYILDIIGDDGGALLPDVLIPIDNEIRDDNKVPNNSFYMYEGDSRGKIIPFTNIMNEFGLVQEYTDLKYDNLKIRFELCYLNNMEEGATPVDEFIYYFDNDNLINLDRYPVVSHSTSRQTANIMNAIAKNVFKYDPHLVLDSIIKMNYSSDYIIPKQLGNVKREDYITTDNPNTIPPKQGYDYRVDPRFYYNYGYRDSDNVPHRLQSEWGLRRNLPEMFYWSLDKDEYTLDSMHLLDEVFDFTYDFNKTYEENLRHGLNYIIGYDADKLEQSIKRSVISFSRTGGELKTLQTNHPYSKTCSLDKYKLFTFVKNKNQKIVFDNVKIIVQLNKEIPYNTSTSILGIHSVKYIGENGKSGYLITTTGDAELKHRTQENTTIAKIKNECTFKDLDKNFSQSYDYSRTRFNRITDTLELYDSDDNLVITIQVDEVIDNSRLQMSRWNISNQDNYVMIFKNRELYEHYHTIEYTDISFSVHFGSDIKDTDVFEFVFFLNANNTIMKKMCEDDEDIKLKLPDKYYSNSSQTIRKDMNGDLMDKGLYQTITSTMELPSAIACNTSIIDAENVQLLINIMPSSENDTWDVTNNDNTTYELSYDMKSYRATTSNDYNSKRFIHSLEDDKKINGLHRVTKQGGGEYILTFNGVVPENNTGTSDDGNTHINPGGSSGIMGIGLMAFATGNVNNMTFDGTMEEWNAISKTLPWIRDANNLNNRGGIKCSDGNILVPLEETQNGMNVSSTSMSVMKRRKEEE